MKQFLSSRVLSIPPSATLETAALVHRLREEGKSVISFTLGEPQFKFPESVISAVETYLDARSASYPPIKGRVALIETIRDYYKNQHSLEFTRDEVIIGNGGKQILINAFLATLNPGDEVVVQSPYYVSYPLMVSLAGGKPVEMLLDSSNDFDITAEHLESLITPKTKWLMLNTPNNPTGAVLSAETLENIAEVLRKHPQVLVMLDEMYERLIFEGSYHSLAKVAPDLRGRILHVNGVSKSYAMTGWRLGYGLAPSWLISAMSSIQGNTTSGVCEAAQVAATAAIKFGDDSIKESLELYRSRRDLICGALIEMGLELSVPQGAFYAFPKITHLLGKRSKIFGEIKTDVDFCQALLKEKSVACVAGSALGAAGYIRLSFAGSEEDLRQGAALIKEFISELS